MSESLEPATNGTDTYPELDVKKLHALPSEQQDLYLLTFSSDLARHVSSLDNAGAAAQQIYIKKELFKTISLVTPTPSRIIRRNLGRCFAEVFGKGDRKLLFESINELAALVNIGKPEKEPSSRLAAIQCLGAVFEAAGDSAINLSGLAATSLLKTLKAAQNNAGLRGAIFEALSKIYAGIGSSGDDGVARDVWKQARSAAAGDKSFHVQIKACSCLESLCANTTFFDNSSDFEKLQNVIWKTIDSPVPRVRHAAANCLAKAMVKVYCDDPTAAAVALVRSKKPKKSSKKPKAEDEENELERVESPAPGKGSAVLSLGLDDLLKILSSQYCKAASSNRARAGIVVCYIRLLKGIGGPVIELKYGDIVRHLCYDLLCQPAILQNRYRLLITRKFIQKILEDAIGKGMLGEAAQLRAAKQLINDVLKDYPQALKERPEPPKQVLSVALSALTSLIKMLGTAVNAIAEQTREALLQVLTHPSYTVQLHVALCLRAFVLACPAQLLPSVTICMNSVNRELGLLAGGRQSPRRCTGYANGLATILSASAQQPLYGSVDVFSRVLSQATTLLKSSSSSDLRISGVQLQVAWILLGGLMSLGPSFVKIHISQLLLLWKNALPKPLNKDNMSSRNMLELSFLAHVRECALGAMLTFLEYNSRLLTLDVTKRLAAMLHNTATFLNGLPSKKTTEDIAQRLSPNLQLQDYDMMVRRRVFQCYKGLISHSPSGSGEALLQSSFLPLAIASFAHPESYGVSSLSASIASSAANFENIWEVGDNYGFGVTGLMSGLDVMPLPGLNDRSSGKHWKTMRGIEASVNQLLLLPFGKALEHDSVALYRATDGSSIGSDPPATEVVNAAIQVFATALPHQAASVQISVLDQLTSYLADKALQRDPARRAAMTVNIAVALLAMLKVATRETSLAAGDLSAEAVQKAVKELLRGFLLDSDQYVRNVGSEAIGRLCKLASNGFTVREVDDLIDQIVANREPTARAGYSLALGQIYAQLGGMAAGFHLKKILGVLNSLSNDPHPTVHASALESICRVSESADLNFAPFVNSTLGMIAQLLTSEAHNEESSSLAFSNLEIVLKTPAVIARSLDSMINVLGPDLQDTAKTRELVTGLVDQFKVEGEELILIQALRCQEHLYVFAPGFINFSGYVQTLQSGLDSNLERVQELAIDGLHNLMRRNADEVIAAAKAGLEDRIWLCVDIGTGREAAQKILVNWVEQTGLTDTGAWVKRCSGILTRMSLRQVPVQTSTGNKSRGLDLQDEEVAGFASAAGLPAGDESQPTSAQELLRWQTRSFALDLLKLVLAMVSRDAEQHSGSHAELALQAKVADVVRVAFSASTAGVVPLRIQGLEIIEQVLKLFGRTPDPDFPEVSLLEQYQAQIGSALTPAFAADSSPELAAGAVNVCATFIATGIVTDVERMGRILKLLVTALQDFSDGGEMAAIGDLKGLSSNALIMVKMAVFSAWAKLQIASPEQKYLVDVVKPHISKLTPLWLSSLREYARLRFEPEISNASGPISLTGDLDTIYAALNRETLLGFYQTSWLQFVEAIASLIEEDSAFVFDALDGKDLADDDGPPNSRNEISYRDEPVAFFFVLFGLAFEALAGKSSEHTSGRRQTLEILRALEKILQPSVAGLAIYQEVVFSEAMDLLDRLVLTEPLPVQAVIVQIARNLCLGHPSARRGAATAMEEERLSEDIDQLFELTRIIVLVLAGLVPNLTGDKGRTQHVMNDEAVALLTSSLSALVDASAVFPSIIKTDLHTCIMHVFATIFANPTCQQLVIPQALPIFRRFLSAMIGTESGSPLHSDTANLLRSALARLLVILKHAQRGDFDAAAQCERNTLLSLTILISTGSKAFAPDDVLLDRLNDCVFDMLSDKSTTKTAASCARTLLLLPKRSITDETIAANLIPGLLDFCVNAKDAEDLEGSRVVIVQALTTFCLSLVTNDEKAQAAIALVLPALISRAEKAGKESYKDTAARILEMASGVAMPFRLAAAALSTDQKSTLERVLRKGGTGKRETVQRDSGEPTIALKMDF